MKYLETEHEKNSAKITAVIIALVILVLFISGPKYMDPPDEYGVVMDFGGASSSSSSQAAPAEPVKDEPVEEVQPQKVEEVEEKPAESAAEKVLTQESEEAIAVKKAEKEQKAKEAAEAKEKAKEAAKEAERLEKIQKEEARVKKEQADKKAKLDAMMGGLNKSDGKGTGESDGKNDKGSGNDGLGDAYGNSYYGKGSGDGGKGYGLKGRGNATFSTVDPICNEEGKVVVEVIVDRSGKVIKATPGKKGSVADLCLYDAAKKTALTHRWRADSKAPTKQIGFVVVEFRLGQ